MARNEWHTVGVRCCGWGARSEEKMGRKGRREASALGGRGRSALGRVLHAGLQPALGDGKKPGSFARGEGFVKTEHAAVAAVALGAMD